jgi:hypothetical protein
MKRSSARAVLLFGFVLVFATSVAWALMGEQEAKLLPSDGAAGDSFGQAVALDGDTALVGAVWDTDNGSFSGSAYVFTRTAGVWTEQAKLLASDGGPSDLFGFSVALDGDTAVVGALRSGSDWGSAYVFTRTGAVWTQQAKLTPANSTGEDYLGYSVAIDGDTVIVGAPDWSAANSPGQTFVFTRTGATWSEQQVLVPAVSIGVDQFGHSVALDGDTALIGAYGAGPYRGAAYVFTRTGGVWSEDAKFENADAENYDDYGWGVALDGDTAIVGAPRDDVDGTISGAAFVFTYAGGLWSEQATLLPSDPVSDQWFGRRIALVGDTTIVGAPFTGASGSPGAAYLFTRDAGVWTEQDKVMPADGTGDDLFGWDLGLEGDTVLFGAVNDNDNGIGSGSAYVFRLGPDQDVPAVGHIGMAVLALVVLGTGFAFLRRRGFD